jgi:hypothetical protein
MGRGRPAPTPHRPSEQSYVPRSAYQFNSSGETNTITRAGVGNYRVDFPQLPLEQGTVQLSVFGSEPAQCKVAWWGPDNGVQVRCFTLDGTPRDTAFNATFLASTGLSQLVAVPSYIYPDLGEADSQWTKLMDGFPTVGLVIINPDNGPGASLNDDYAALVDAIRDRDRDVIVLGYVYTDYGARPTSEGTPDVPSIEDDIDDYYDWYGVDGIFFDEAFSDDCSKEPYYREIYNYVKDMGEEDTVVINPGVRTEECYASTADIIVTFEGTYASYIAAEPLTDEDWESGEDARKFWHLVHATAADDMPNAIQLSKQRNAGWVYVTPDEMPNPWDDLPPEPYWSDEQAAAAAV